MERSFGFLFLRRGINTALPRRDIASLLSMWRVPRSTKFVACSKLRRAHAISPPTDAPTFRFWGRAESAVGGLDEHCGWTRADRSLRWPVPSIASAPCRLTSAVGSTGPIKPCSSQEPCGKCHTLESIFSTVRTTHDHHWRANPTGAAWRLWSNTRRMRRNRGLPLLMAHSGSTVAYPEQSAFGSRTDIGH